MSCLTSVCCMVSLLCGRPLWGSTAGAEDFSVVVPVFGRTLESNAATFVAKDISWVFRSEPPLFAIMGRTFRS